METALAVIDALFTFLAYFAFFVTCITLVAERAFLATRFALVAGIAWTCLARIAIFVAILFSTSETDRTLART